SKIVGIWLASCSFMVAGAILIGGYTRLKNAGLSMVKWQLVNDMILPTSDEKWIQLYEEYKQYPEYNYSSNEITLNKFKKIYFLEYFHRIWGRLTGAVFIIPTVLLFATGKLKGMEKRVIIYNLLVLAQGIMGWIMVKSGLKEDTMATHGEPGVSQYRLAAHLGLAFILYSLTMWQTLRILLPPMK
ncbi:heme A synthase COX15-like, partial [Pempheris klunzingeri]|uniref:heme A synthase COX15-like n=1 Tax=Pempheris klunzingeri TaxID=3127111 RepID=UPI003980E040